MSSKSLSSVKVTRPVRLYLLLSWLVAGYYVISISRDGLLGDVMFPKVTDAAGLPETQSPHSDVNQLLFKQLNELKSCPVVKVRGLSRSKGKARPMNRFEEFIFLNGMYFVLRLRSLVSLIKDLLLRAGDVEVNPGPTPPVTPDRGESSTGIGSLPPVTPDRGESSTVVRPPTPVTPDRGESSTAPTPVTPDHGESSTVVRPPTPVTPDRGESSTAPTPVAPDRGESSTSNFEVNPGQGSPYHYESTPDSDQLEPLVENSDMSIHGQTQLAQATISPADNEPVDRKFSERPTSQSDMLPRNDPQRFPSEKKDEFRNDDNRLELPPPQQQGIQQDTMDSGGAAKQSFIPILLPGTGKVHKMKRSSTASSVHIASKKADTRKEVLKLQKNVLDLHSNLPKMEELKQTCDLVLNQLLNFFIAANKLYSSGEKCQVCPTCLKLKEYSGGQRKSHVIPKCILQYYWEIHSTDKQTPYIHDFSRIEMLAPGSLTYQLLCGNCEVHYSTKEELLLGVYIRMAANPETDFVIEHGDEQPTSWLKYILANILFRGILAITDLDIDHSQWKLEIHSLWKFCCNIELMNEESDTEKRVPDVKVFLLPNKPFHQTLDNFMFPFEMLVRMPHCTKLVFQEDVGTFFYTKFDIFHIVLPLCKKSKNYFDTFDNGLFCDGRNVHLRWATLQRAEISREKKYIEFKYPTEAASLKNHFPEALLKWAASLYEMGVSRLYNHPRTLPPFLSLLDRYNNARYVGFDTKERMKYMMVPKDRHSGNQREIETTSYKEHHKFSKQAKKMKQYVLKAAELSPLRRRDVEERRIMEQDLKKQSDALQDAITELGNTRQELGDTRQKLEQQESTVAWLNEKIFRLEGIIERVESNLLSSRAELQNARDINITLVEITEAQIKADKEELELLTFLYKSSLRHNLSPEYLPKVGTNELKVIIAKKARNFENLSEIALNLGPGTSSYQSYRELHEGYQHLLSLTLPS